MSDTFDPAGEARFVARVRAGLPEAVAVFEKRTRCVARFVRALNARRGRPFAEQDLDDIAQDIQVTALRKLPDYRPLAPLEHWLYRICCNEFLNALRRRDRHQRHRAESEVADLAGDPGSVSTVDDDVHRALERLGGLEADIIRLKHFEGLTFAEIARRTDTSENTVKTRYYRGLERLEALLRRGLDDEERHA